MFIPNTTNPYLNFSHPATQANDSPAVQPTRRQTGVPESLRLPYDNLISDPPAYPTWPSNPLSQSPLTTPEAAYPEASSTDGSLTETSWSISSTFNLSSGPSTVADGLTQQSFQRYSSLKFVPIEARIRANSPEWDTITGFWTSSTQTTSHTPVITNADDLDLFLAESNSTTTSGGTHGSVALMASISAAVGVTLAFAGFLFWWKGSRRSWKKLFRTRSAQHPSGVQRQVSIRDRLSFWKGKHRVQ